MNIKNKICECKKELCFGVKPDEDGDAVFCNHFPEISVTHHIDGTIIDAYCIIDYEINKRPKGI